MTKPTLYIHVGPHKTGTTTIQQNLFENRDALERLNYIYPHSTIISFGHHNLVGQINDMYWHSGRHGSLDDLKAEISGTGKNVILSSETFVKIEDVEPLKVLKRTFSADFDIKIIPYLRSQVNLMPSMWKTDLLMGKTSETFITWLETALKFEVNLHFDRWLALYETVFGRDNILPQVYQPKNPDHFSSFLNVCGIPDSRDFKPIGSKNISFSDYQALVFSSLVLSDWNDSQKSDFTQRLERSPELRRMVMNKVSDERHIVAHINIQIGRFLTRHKIDQSGTLLTRELMSRILSTYQTSNQTVGQKYFGNDRIFAQAPPSNFIERNFFRRLTKPQLIELCNLVFITYRRNEMILAKDHAA